MSPDAIALWTETSSDPELIAGVRAGDGTAFGVLYERQKDAARKVAAQYTNSASDVDDVVAESFSRVLRALQRGDGPKDFFLVGSTRRRQPIDDGRFVEPAFATPCGIDGHAVAATKNLATIGPRLPDRRRDLLQVSF